MGLLGTEDGFPLLVVAAVAIRDGRLLASYRPPGLRHGGYWELPGGKIGPGESPQEALVRELKEELGVGAEVGSIYDVIHHCYPEGAVLLLVYRVSMQGEPEAKEPGVRITWADSQEVIALDWLPADVRLVRELARELRRSEG